MKTLENIKTITNKTRTENFDLAYNTTFDKNLDFFSSMGSMRQSPEKLLNLFIKANNEDEELAIRNLFYLRDIRGGMGERNSFRVILEYLSKIKPESIIKILEEIPEYGRWDDILVLLNNKNTRSHVVKLIDSQIKKDLIDDNPSLLGKWLPSINTSSKETRQVALRLSSDLKMSKKQYRKTLSTLRKKIDIIETKLSKKQYDFDYSKIPSLAMKKYQKAFDRNDQKRFHDYLDRLSQGEEKINVSTLYPYEIIKNYLNHLTLYTPPLNPSSIKLMEEQWKALERNTTNTNTIVVRDGSGSMAGRPLTIATSLAILYSEQIKGEFKDKFITFSSKPELVSLENLTTLEEKLQEISTYDDITNTDIEKVYNLILKSSLNVKKEDQIEKVIIISDMEFDYSMDINKSTFQSIKEKYKKENIKFPEIVFWNVATRSVHFPTTDKENVKLISGFSNHILQDILNDKTTSPRDFMIKVLKNYENVSDKYLKKQTLH